MATAPQSIGEIVNTLRNQNANLPTEKKQNIIVVQDTAAAREDKSGQMLSVLSNIYNLMSEQLRLTKENLRLQQEDRTKPSEFQKEAMDVSSGKYEPSFSGGEGGGGEGGGEGGAVPAGGTGGIADQVGKVGGGLWESIKGVGRKAVDIVKENPIAAAAGAGAAIGGGFKYADTLKTNKEKDKLTLQVYDSYRNAGLSDKQAKAMTAEVGRENEFNPNNLFGVHTDAANKATNIGMLSWQGDRAENLRKTLSEKGLLTKEGTIQKSQDSLNAMAQFSVSEMQKMKSGQQFLSNPDIGSEEAAELMGGTKGVVGWAMHQTKLRSGASFDWEAHNKKRKGHYDRLSGLLESSDAGKNEKNTSTRIANSQENENPTATKMVDPSELRVKGGMKGQAFKGGDTQEGVLNLARSIQADEENMPGGLNRFSSFNDDYHTKANPKSKHTQGLAMDFSLKDAKKSNEASDYVKQKLLGSGLNDDEFKIINEYENPSKHSTGGHIHVNFANKEAAEKYASISNGQQKETTTTEIKSEGRHKLEATDEKSSVIQASMFAPFEKAVEKMGDILTSADNNDKKETASKVEDGEEQSKDTTSMIKGSDEGSNVMKMLFGEGGFMGSAEPIEPGSEKRKYIDSLPNKTDVFGKQLLDSLGIDSGGAASQQNNLGNQNNTLENLGVTPITPFNGNVAGGMLGGLGDMAGSIGGMLGSTPFNGNVAGGMLGGFGQQGNNPFYDMQNVLGKVGSVASMGQNIGQMSNQGGLGGVQGIMGQVGGILGSMGQNFPMAQQIGGVLGQAGNVLGSVRGFENIGGGFGSGGGVMGGIGTAQSVLGSLGNVFGGMQGMMGTSSNMGLSSIGSGIGDIGSSIGNAVSGLFGGGSSSDKSSVSTMGIGDDAASLKSKLTQSSTPMGGDLSSVQASNDFLSQNNASSQGQSPNTTSSPAEPGTSGQSQGASASPKALSGNKTGSSSGAMGLGMEGYNDCPTLYKWQFRTSYWGKV